MSTTTDEASTFAVPTDGTRTPAPERLLEIFPNLDGIAARVDIDPRYLGAVAGEHVARLASTFVPLATWRDDIRATYGRLLLALHRPGEPGARAAALAISQEDFAQRFEDAVSWLLRGDYVRTDAAVNQGWHPLLIAALDSERRRGTTGDVDVAMSQPEPAPEPVDEALVVARAERDEMRRERDEMRREHDTYRRQVEADMARLSGIFTAEAIRHALCAQYDAAVAKVNAVTQVLRLDEREHEHSTTVNVSISAELTGDGLGRLGLDRYDSTLSITGTVPVSVSWICHHEDADECDDENCYEIDMDGYSTYFTVTDYEIA